MNQLEKFNDTVGVLVKAYLNDTLIVGACCACAVGNLIAAKNQYKRTQDGAWVDAVGNRIDHTLWYDASVLNPLLNSDSYYTEEEYEEELHNSIGLAQIESIGYTPAEVVLIEAAFEGRGNWPLAFGEECDFVLSGLMNVVDALGQIHGVDLTTTEAAKALFVRA